MRIQLSVLGLISLAVFIPRTAEAVFVPGTVGQMIAPASYDWESNPSWVYQVNGTTSTQNLDGNAHSPFGWGTDGIVLEDTYRGGPTGVVMVPTPAGGPTGTRSLAMSTNTFNTGVPVITGNNDALSWSAAQLAGLPNAFGGNQGYQVDAVTKSSYTATWGVPDPDTWQTSNQPYYAIHETMIIRNNASPDWVDILFIKRDDGIAAGWQNINGDPDFLPTDPEYMMVAYVDDPILGVGQLPKKVGIPNPTAGDDGVQWVTLGGSLDDNALNLYMAPGLSLSAGDFQGAYAAGEVTQWMAGASLYLQQSYFANTQTPNWYIDNLKLFSNIVPGDANMDGVVDATDVAIISGNLGMTNAGWINGNFNGGNFGVDYSTYATGQPFWPGGVVDFSDLAEAQSPILPEPSSMSLLALGLVSLLRLRRSPLI